jgi:hypothetical protein
MSINRKIIIMNNSKLWVIMLFALLAMFIATILLVLSNTLPNYVTGFYTITSAIALFSLLFME